MYCWSVNGVCKNGTFATAAVPLYNERNVGWSLTFANLLFQTLPPNHGVVIVNTGVGGTGFREGNWYPPNGPLAVRSVRVMRELVAVAASQLGEGSSLRLHAMLWHQGEDDAGDNRVLYHADYCNYLVNDQSALIDFFRASFPFASASTPFINGQLLPYWIDNVINGTGGVPRAIEALNTSRACTATANSRIFADFYPDGVTPYGDPNLRSGASNDVIHFDATQAFLLGHEYWSAYLRALKLTAVVPNSETAACPGSVVQPQVTLCG